MSQTLPPTEILPGTGRWHAKRDGGAGLKRASYLEVYAVRIAAPPPLWGTSPFRGGFGMSAFRRIRQPSKRPKTCRRLPFHNPLLSIVRNALRAPLPPSITPAQAVAQAQRGTVDLKATGTSVPAFAGGSSCRRERRIGLRLVPACPHWSAL